MRSPHLLVVALTLLSAAPAAAGLTLQRLATFESGIFDDGGAEIVAFDATTQRAFVVNAGAVSVDVLSLADPSAPVKVGAIDASVLGASANSVDVANGVLAVAIEADPKTDPGVVAFYRTSDLVLLGSAPVGALPDMVVFTPDGTKALVANEGEPSGDYSVDPEGSVSVIDLAAGPAAATVRTADFRRYIGSEAALRAEGIRIYGPGANVAQDLEPEYITIDDNFAYVTLQEANALAEVDIAKAKVKRLIPLGFKDHALRAGDGSAVNPLDASDRDSARNAGINIDAWPVFGMYQPDGIASYRAGGKTYLVTANEGDAREVVTEDEVVSFAEEARVRSVVLDSTAFPDGATLRDNANLGRLNVTNQLGDSDGDGDFDRLHSFGARSFSIWAVNGKQIFDSAAQLETITATLLPGAFNSTHDTPASFDTRSDNKGPEPEGVVVGQVGERSYAFVGLERIGGVMVYDVTVPAAPSFESYANFRDFAVDVCVRDTEDECIAPNSAAGDLAPEGLEFVPAAKSPNGKPLLLVGNEVSGTTTIWQVNAD